MKIKKVKFAGDWGKVPVFTDENGTHHVDSTPLLKHIDQSYNNGAMANQGDNERQEKWLIGPYEDVKSNGSILYGTIGSALKQLQYLEVKFGFFQSVSMRGQFPCDVGYYSRRVQKDGRTPKKLWHDLLPNSPLLTSPNLSLVAKLRPRRLRCMDTCAQFRRSHNSTFLPTMNPVWRGTTAWKRAFSR